MLRAELDENQIENVFKILQQLPVINVNISVRGWWPNTQNQSEERVFIKNTGTVLPFLLSFRGIVKLTYTVYYL